MGVTRRVWRELPPRPVCWFDFVRGQGVTDDGARVATVPRPPVGVLLAAIPPAVEIVNLTGGRPGDTPDAFHQWCDGALPDGWRADGHFLRRLTMPILRYAHAGVANVAPRRRVEIQRAAAWFGDGDYTPEQCRAALALVAELVEVRFGKRAMRVRPASTGQELALRMLPRGVEFEVLELELANVLRSSSGQGRIEHHAGVDDELEQLVEYDGRFMYAALCRELPAGPLQVGDGDGGFDLYARGRYLVEWRVPRGWSHLGLLPMKADDGATWRYPRVEGERGQGWVDAVELHLAAKHGWRYRVCEHMVWPARGDPLGRWARELIGARDTVALHVGRGGGLGVGVEVAELARAALRAIALFGLGAFYGRPYMVTHRAELGTRLPAEARNVSVDGGQVVYELEAARQGPALSHPEWPATVWARCRVRMLDGPRGTGALHVPLEHVVGIHTDALYLAADPRWSDDGDAGRLRHKHTWPGPFPWPANDSELTRLVRELRKENGGETEV